MFKKLFGREKSAKPNADSGKDGGKPVIPNNFDDLQEMAFHHVQALTSAHQGAWGMGSDESWAVDLQAGIITWTFADRMVTAPAELIATYNGCDGTYLWGWDHPSAPEGSAVAAMAVKAHADAHDIKQLQISKVACSLDDAWQLAAMAVLTGDLQGIYRGPAGGETYAFIGFDGVTLKGI